MYYKFVIGVSIDDVVFDCTAALAVVTHAITASCTITAAVSCATGAV